MPGKLFRATVTGLAILSCAGPALADPLSACGWRLSQVGNEPDGCKLATPVYAPEAGQGARTVWRYLDRVVIVGRSCRGDADLYVANGFECRNGRICFVSRTGETICGSSQVVELAMLSR
jgi:hypothetical protein